jgi:hypothetical protein
MFTKRLWSVCCPLLWAVSEWARCAAPIPCRSDSKGTPNQALHLTGAAILVSRHNGVAGGPGR